MFVPSFKAAVVVLVLCACESPLTWVTRHLLCLLSFGASAFRAEGLVSLLPGSADPFVSQCLSELQRNQPSRAPRSSGLIVEALERREQCELGQDDDEEERVVVKEEATLPERSQGGAVGLVGTRPSDKVPRTCHAECCGN